MQRSGVGVRSLLILAAAAAASSPGRAQAQTIPIRTVPVASGDQFFMLPSATVGMGGVRLAVDDSLADGWSNPAKGVLVRESAFVGSPTYYSIGDDQGGGRTFPVAGLFRASEWFAGAALAVQQIDNSQGVFNGCGWWGCGGGGALSQTYGSNLYGAGYVGRRVGEGWAVGVGFSLGRLRAMDGVDLLYSGAQSIDQAGSTKDLRLGVHKEGERDRLSLVLLHDRVSMEHGVVYVDWVWDEVQQQGLSLQRKELNEDKTRTWGGQLSWDRALDTPGWRVGASGTINYKDHPEIPNYSIQNIPRDPGSTWAYEVAVGFSKSVGGTTYGLDVALQPIWSETWQEANAEDVLDSGLTLSIGDHSIDNDFFFTNLMMRSGLSHEVRNVTAQVGLEIRSFSYTLEQVNHVERSFREQDESWVEWTPTLGATLRLEALELRYTGKITTGTGLPGLVQDRFAVPGIETLSSGSDVILAPDGPLTLQDTPVTTHQLAVRIPIR